MAGALGGEGGVAKRIHYETRGLLFRADTRSMPELPDITVYVEALGRRVFGRRLERVRVRSPFLVRTFDPPLDSVEGKTVREFARLGKRIAIGFDDDLWLILHLMIAGRLHWQLPGAGIAAQGNL